MPDQVTFLTQEGLKKIQEDLEYLRIVKRPQVILQLQDALEQASALENPDYEVAKNEQAFVEGRILQLEQILRNVVIIEKRTPRGIVELGSQVIVTEGQDGDPETYVVVGSAEADPSRGYISNESPLGRVLMGKKIGDQVTVNAPAGEIVFFIQSVD
ncbi:MAG: transcription elongation factor GreA [Anaerolineae bacterium]|nr:transcription elongation factor GreA [Anaerolineae bacterium]